MSSLSTHNGKVVWTNYTTNGKVKDHINTITDNQW